MMKGRTKPCASVRRDRRYRVATCFCGRPEPWAQLSFCGQTLGLLPDHETAWRCADLHRQWIRMERPASEWLALVFDAQVLMRRRLEGEGWLGPSRHCPPQALAA